MFNVRGRARFLPLTAPSAGQPLPIPQRHGGDDLAAATDPAPTTPKSRRKIDQISSGGLAAMRALVKRGDLRVNAIWQTAGLRFSVALTNRQMP